MRLYPFLLLTLLLLGATLSAQSNQNYFDRCQQLDTFFAHEYQAETDCWDNDFIKYQRWKWIWRDRVLPDGHFPNLEQQWQVSKALRSNQAARGNSISWNFEGPDRNTGGGYWGMGRTKHVAFHPTNPDLFYVGTPDGGIWKTTNGGLQWTTLGDELPYLPVGIIRIDHQQPDTLYITLGGKNGWWEWGLGVYKSTDGGASWAPTGLSNQLDEFWVVYSLEMHPTNPQTLVAATNKGLWKTTDGGINWEKKMEGEIVDFKYKPNDPNTTYAAYHNYWEKDQVFKSYDGGETWTQISDFTISQNDIRLAVSPVAPDLLGVKMSNGKQFWLSKNSGQSFEYRSAFPEDWQFNFSPTDSNVVYTAGVVVYKSTDQGLTWNQITNWYNNGQHPEVHADVHDIVHYPHNPNLIFFCNDGGIYRYHESANNWTDLSNGLGIAQFYRISVSENGLFRLAAGSQDNGGWLRKGGSTWIHTNGGDAMTQAIDPGNSNILFTEYYGGNELYRSTNSGQSLQTITQNLPDDPSGDWVTPFIMNPQRSASMLYGFHDIYRTFDRGDHFHKLTNNLTGSVDNKLRDVRYAPSDTNIIVATWRNKLYRSTNGGQTWVTRTIPGNEDITRVAIHPEQPGQMWVCKAGYEAGKKVYKSYNNGALWINISENLPNVPINCVLYDAPTNYLFIGTDIGVFYSDATEIDWQLYGQGLPAVWVLDLQIRQASRVLYAGTHGRGVWSVPVDLITSTVPTALPATDFKIYPNPAGDQLYVQCDHLSKGGHLVLMDALGRPVLNREVQSIDQSPVLVSLSGLPPGLYALHYRGWDGQFQVSKTLLKQ